MARAELFWLRKLELIGSYVSHSLIARDILNLNPRKERFKIYRKWQISEMHLRWSLAPDPAGGAHDAPSDPLVSSYIPRLDSTKSRAHEVSTLGDSVLGKWVYYSELNRRFELESVIKRDSPNDAQKYSALTANEETQSFMNEFIGLVDTCRRIC